MGAKLEVVNGGPSRGGPTGSASGPAAAQLFGAASARARPRRALVAVRDIPGRGQDARERQPRHGAESEGPGGSPPGRPERATLRGGETGPAVRVDDRFGGRDTEKARSRVVEPGPDREEKPGAFGRLGDPTGAVEPRAGGSFGSCLLRSRPGAFRASARPPCSSRTDLRNGGRDEPREGWSSGHSTGRGSGEPGNEPHGREWMKDSTGSEEEQAVKVVGNGGGGPKRVWKPATRHGGTAAV